MQTKIVEMDATQCGFCTPGFVMSMVALLRATGNTPSAAQIEAAFDGNLCRCTGYTKIIDAIVDASERVFDGASATLTDGVVTHG